MVAARAWFAVTLHVPIPITNFAMGPASRIDASIRHCNIMIAYETEVVGSFGKTPLQQFATERAPIRETFSAGLGQRIPPHTVKNCPVGARCVIGHPAMTQNKGK